MYVDEALENYEKETEQWPETIAKYKKTLEEWEQNDNMELDVNERKRRKKEKPKEPKAPIPRMQFTEDTNFLWLATALKLLLAPSVTDSSIIRGEQLLQEYLIGYLEVWIRSHFYS